MIHYLEDPAVWVSLTGLIHTSPLTYPVVQQVMCSCRVSCTEDIIIAISPSERSIDSSGVPVTKDRVFDVQ